MDFSWFKLHFTFQINVSGSQKSHIKVVVNAADGKIQFRMVCNDLVRRLALIDLFTASIADVGSPIKPAAAFFLKIRKGLVTGGTGSTFNAAEKKEKWNSNFYFRHRNTVRI